MKPEVPDATYTIDKPCITKQSFKLLNKKNGVLLNIHHTVSSSDGQITRVRFIHVCFSDSNEFIIAVDHR